MADRKRSSKLRAVLRRQAQGRLSQSSPALPPLSIYETVAELSDRLAVPIPNEHTDRYVAKAKERGIFIQTGSFLEVDARWPQAVFNTTCLIGPDGILSRYRKVNPWIPWEGPRPVLTICRVMTSRCSRWSRPRSAFWERQSATTGCFPRRSAHWLSEARKS